MASGGNPDNWPDDMGFISAVVIVVSAVVLIGKFLQWCGVPL